MKILNCSDESARVAFRRMAALLAAIDHPGLARVHEAGEADGRPYLVTDLIEGRSLARVLGGGRLAVHDTIRLGIDVAAHTEHHEPPPEQRKRSLLVIEQR